MIFTDFVCFDATVTTLDGMDRDKSVEQLVSALDKAGKVGNVDVQKIAKAIIERENEASTGLGKGVAIPHIKYPGIKKMVAVIGKSETGIYFSALDKQPVYSVILLLSPADDPDRHLQAMEIIFKHLQNDKFRSFLKQAQTPQAIEELLREADENKII